ncbi:MAG: LamG domain-containing protein [Candidatus Micrarchaeota archaeon]|nr:LamG domain-containing protein [Candidatus Micrarchaeota archaeon]
MQGKRKSQSAMEYLMTYGWAILAIAIVMVSLYSLGIFNSGNLQPVATPGSCQVVKTAAQTSLAGQCSNLIPKYVGKFNGASSYITVKNSASLQNANTLTLEGWIRITPTGNTETLMSKYGGSTSFWALVDSNTSTARLVLRDTALSLIYINGTSNVSDGKWHQLVGTRGNGKLSIYVDGQLQNSQSDSLGLIYNTFDLGLGKYLTNANPLNGIMADLQVYNVSLDNSSVKALYQEGIGGAPIDIRHLVAWWPLNGNANDYSGNNNQGTATNVAWNANWQSGYTAPTT